jgi:hypothetical protein
MVIDKKSGERVLSGNQPSAISPPSKRTAHHQPSAPLQKDGNNSQLTLTLTDRPTGPVL